jgi:hypothetical protein
LNARVFEASRIFKKLDTCLGFIRSLGYNFVQNIIHDHVLLDLPPFVPTKKIILRQVISQPHSQCSIRENPNFLQNLNLKNNKFLANVFA